MFDCLDKPNDSGKIIYEDGFSRNPYKKSIVPDYLFFTEEDEADLGKYYNIKSSKYKVRGLFNILHSYKFTINESTPIDEEVALDPELLGRVFENLLASYNPETATTARKATGSYYTPREIVDYMVETSLIEHLKLKLPEIIEEKVKKLVTYSEEIPEFSKEEKQKIIQAIDEIKIIDPACGSGAFPMGILHRLVYILQKYDPENIYWKEIQKTNALKEAEKVFKVDDSKLQEELIKEINDVFENNTSDYGRKLFLIEKCIYGVDIQPIAVQMAKLRFFISLIIDQKINHEKENLGIRSLPNLETNFVAANTLIDLDHMSMDKIRADVVFNKEEELKEVRHKYFAATSRSEILKLQKKTNN